MLTGSQVKRLMRRYGVTIEELARRMQVPQRRIRTVRASGVIGGYFYDRDWIQAITGKDPGVIRRQEFYL